MLYACDMRTSDQSGSSIMGNHVGESNINSHHPLSCFQLFINYLWTQQTYSGFVHTSAWNVRSRLFTRVWDSTHTCICDVNVCVCLHACVYDWTLLKLYPVESSIRKIQSSPKYAYQHAGPSHKCSTFCDLTGQDLSDVLLYASHPDHQLKGLTALAVGCLIQAILVEGRGDFSCWFRLHSAPENGMLSLTFMVDCFVLIDKNKCVTD